MAAARLDLVRLSLARALGISLAALTLACGQADAQGGLDDTPGAADCSTPAVAEHMMCVPAMWISDTEPPPEGGWPGHSGWDEPELDQDGDGFADVCPSTPGGETGGEIGSEMGRFTCDCVVAKPEVVYDEILEVDAEVVGETCCFVWSLERPSPCIGRPFLVNGELRRADVQARVGWAPDAERLGSVDAIACVRQQNPAAAESIANAWIEDARMEHASIAAFSRFIMQLMALGCPADLIDDAQAAVRDELEHTRTCFSMAAAYSGIELGPKPFPMHDLGDSLSSPKLRDVLRDVLLEGCIGETLAAVGAGEAASGCEVLEVREALEQIAADELRHAELAWRFVAWAREQDSTLTDGVIGEVLAQSRGCGAGGSQAVHGQAWAGLAAHGRLGAQQRAELDAKVMRELVHPLLLGMTSTTRAAA